MPQPANNSPQDQPNKQQPNSKIDKADLEQAESEPDNTHQPGEVYHPGGAAQQPDQAPSQPVSDNNTPSLNMGNDFSQANAQAANKQPQTPTRKPDEPHQPTPPPQGAGGGGKPPAQPKVNPSAHPESPPPSKGGKHHWLLIGLALLLTLLLALAGAWAYQEYIAPKRAVESYLNKQLDHETQAFSGQITWETAEQTNNRPQNPEPNPGSFFGQGGGYQINADLTFSGVVDRREDKQQSSLHMKGDVDFNGLSSNLDLDLVAEGETLYLKLNELGFLDAFGADIPQQWYSYSLAKVKDEAGGGDSQGECTTKQNKKILAQSMSKGLNDGTIAVERVGFFPETVADTRAAHYTGEIKLRQLNDKFVEESQKVSQECHEQFKLDEDQRGELPETATFDLWRGDNFDRLKFETKISNEITMKLTLDTKEYGQDQTVTIPGDAEPLESIGQQFYQRNMGQPSQRQPEADQGNIRFQ